MKKYEKIDQLVMPIAGFGTRFLPATKAVPKELFPIENKPALLYLLLEAKRSGIKRVCLIVSKAKKHAIENFLKPNKALSDLLQSENRLSLLDEWKEIVDNMEIKMVIQNTKKLFGTGGALLHAKKWCQNKPFAFMYGDDFCISNTKTPVIGQLMQAYEKTGKTVVGVKPFPMEVIHRYSSVVKGKHLFDRCDEMQDIIEKPEKGKAPSNLVGLARYVFTPEIFDEILKCEKFPNNEYRLTDAIQRLAKQGKTVCFEFDGKYFDCGNKLEYIKCILDLALQDKDVAQDLKEYLAKIK